MDRVAFVVGNSAYQASERYKRVRGASDAESVFSVLTGSPSAVFDRELSVCITDVSCDCFHDALNEFFGKLKPDTSMLFYFAGHGQLTRASRLVLAMTDTDPDNVVSSGFVLDLLRFHLEELAIRQYMIVLDCCYAGAGLNLVDGTPRGGPIQADLSAASGEGGCILAGARHYQEAWEPDELRGDYLRITSREASRREKQATRTRSSF